MRRFQTGSANGETPTRRYPGPVGTNPPRSPASLNDADKAAAARKLLAAASPSKRQTPLGGSVTAVTSVTSSAASPVPSPGGHDPGKAAAARRIMLAAAAKKAAAGADDGSGSFDHGDDEEFGLDLVFSPASGAKASAATASGGGGGGGTAGGGGGGTAGGAIAERAVSAQRQLGFAQPGAASDSGNESAAGVYDSAFEFRSPRRHETEVRARMVRLNEVPPPPSVAPAAHLKQAEVSRFGGDAADEDKRRGRRRPFLGGGAGSVSERLGLGPRRRPPPRREFGGASERPPEETRVSDLKGVRRGRDPTSGGTPYYG